MCRSIISTTRASNFSFTAFPSSWVLDFIDYRLLLPPQPLESAVADKKLRFHLIWSHHGNDSRPGQEVWRQLRVLQPLRLNPEGCYCQQDHRTNQPSANKTERCPQQTIGPFELRELHELSDYPNCHKSGKQDHQECNGEAKE